MKVLVAAVLAAAVLAAALPIAAQAEGGDGSRQVAGGGHMSSYVNDPYHDPRSLDAQRRGTGQILGAPMLHDGPAARQPLTVDRVTADRVTGSRWAVGGAARTRR